MESEGLNRPECAGLAGAQSVVMMNIGFWWKLV